MAVKKYHQFKLYDNVIFKNYPILYKQQGLVVGFLGPKNLLVLIPHVINTITKKPMGYSVYDKKITKLLEKLKDIDSNYQLPSISKLRRLSEKEELPRVICMNYIDFV